MSPNHFEARADSFHTLIPPNATVERVATGMAFTEGPVWLERDQRVLFTDIPNNGIMRWNTRDGLSKWSANSHYAIGLHLDLEGRLIACEHTTRRLVRYGHDGSRTILAASHGEFALNSTNDVCVRASDGAVFFTDPPFGVRLDDDGNLAGYQQGMEYGVCGVFKVSHDPTRPHLVTDSIYRPNGLCFSPDEKTLYVSDSSDRHHQVYALELADDDTVKSSKVFAVITPGVPDGMRADTAGRVFISALDGVHVYAPDGTMIGKILIPEMVTNICFGGPGRNTLYATAVSSLYAVRLNTAGVQRP